jgi:NAD(P)-dependent dehydrogenase (short-subunit alcohol dehydrogenase family)
MKRIALITGCSGGIGKAMVARFLAAGYEVVGLDRTTPLGVAPTRFLEADLRRFSRDSAYRARVIEEAAASFGQGMLHALINNAAEQLLAPTAQITQEQWHATLDVNLSAPFFLAQGLLPYLAEAKGTVINIGSVHASLTKPGFAAYSTSKAALVGMTRALAVDIGDRVRVNAICPAAVSTAMLVDGLKDYPGALEKLEEYHPTRHIGRPEEAAALAVMMCSGEMPFLNGSIVTLDGGIGVRLHDPL